jgi:hypothetical protein
MEKQPFMFDERFQKSSSLSWCKSIFVQNQNLFSATLLALPHAIWSWKHELILYKTIVFFVINKTIKIKMHIYKREGIKIEYSTINFMPSWHTAFFFVIVFTFTHMCIYCLGYPTSPHFREEPVLPSCSPILLKRKLKR